MPSSHIKTNLPMLLFRPNEPVVREEKRFGGGGFSLARKIDIRLLFANKRPTCDEHDFSPGVLLVRGGSLLLCSVYTI